MFSRKLWTQALFSFFLAQICMRTSKIFMLVKRTCGFKIGVEWVRLQQVRLDLADSQIPTAYWPCLPSFLLMTFIEIQFMHHTIHPFEVCSSYLLFIHYHIQCYNIFTTLKRNPMPSSHHSHPLCLSSVLLPIKKKESVYDCLWISVNYISITVFTAMENYF